MQESEVEREQPHQGQLLRRALRRSTKKMRVDKAHALARHRRLEVMDKVHKDEAPSNVVEEPRRRAR